MSWSRTIISSMVSEIEYDDASNTMIVTWAKSGRRSAYAGVPEGVAEQATRAPSVGQFMNTEIKPFYSHQYV